MNEYQTIPLSLKIQKNDHALVVGGGRTALQKICWLKQFGMTIEVIAPQVNDEIQALRNQGDIAWREEKYNGLPRQYKLVIAATNDESVNRAVHRDATKQQILFNAVDAPELCTFFVPSIVPRGQLQVAVSSSGNAPALCKRLRKEIGALMPTWYTTYVTLLCQARDIVKEKVFEKSNRKTIHRHMASQEVASELLDAPENERTQMFFQELQHQIKKAAETPAVTGTVYLVGAGPGDRGLITLKGFRALVSADAVLFDGLVNNALIDMLDDSVSTFDTSKRSGCSLRNQDEINQLMVQLAKEGKQVVRLKGGDPCVFGRITDEAKALAREKIPFKVVPGVSSAIGAPAYAGIPITDRDCASYFQVVTGHENPEKTESRVNWSDISQSQGTVVFLMGVHRVKQIARTLIDHGKAPDTPLALISHGTLPSQKVYESTLSQVISPDTVIPEMPRPALFVVGEVVKLRAQLNWFA